MKTSTPVVLLLLCASPALADSSKDPELWITMGAEAIEPLRAMFKDAGWADPAVVQERESVAVFRVRESQLDGISRMMHDRYHRCAGFVTYDTQE
jgi:leucyl aminopeptidase